MKLTLAGATRCAGECVTLISVVSELLGVLSRVVHVIPSTAGIAMHKALRRSFSSVFSGTRHVPNRPLPSVVYQSRSADQEVIGVDSVDGRTVFDARPCGKSGTESGIGGSGKTVYVALPSARPKAVSLPFRTSNVRTMLTAANVVKRVLRAFTPGLPKQGHRRWFRAQSGRCLKIGHPHRARRV